MSDAVAPTERFSDRVADYARHRPGYPRALADWLRESLGVEPGRRVADIGAGTGIATRMWLDAGHDVVAVEPNHAMREAGIAALAGEPRLRWIAGTAEATGLGDAGVDLVSAAQAFHWFDPARTRAEWARILRPGGLAVVFWNSREPARSPLVAGCEALLHEYGRDYGQVAERHPDDAAMERWFGGGLRGTARFPHRQRFDFEGLRGRLLSSSSAPRPGEPGHAAMIADLRALFLRHAVEGMVDFDYATRVFAGTLAQLPPTS
jgi:SAM-dependent methyltransferase